MCVLGKKHKKRWMAALLCLFFVLCNFIPGEASDINTADKTVNRRVKAGVFYFEGYHSKDEDGNLTGYGIEVLQMLSQYSHLNFDYVGY